MNDIEFRGRLGSVYRMLGHLKPYRLKVTFAVLTGIIKELFIILAVGICAYMAAFVAKGNHFTSSIWMWILAAVVIGRAVSAYLESFLSHDVAYHILVDFRVKLYRSFASICPDILLRQRSGQISTTLMNDVEVMEWFYAHTAGLVIVDSVVVLAITIFLGNLHWSLSVLLLACVVLLLIVPFVMKGKADEQGKESRFRLGEANSVTLEGINGMNELLTLNSVESYKKKNRKFMDALIDIQVRYARRMGTEGGMLQVISGLAAVAINLCGIYLVFQGELSMEWYAVIGTTVWLVFNPILEFCNMARNFGIIFAASARIDRILQSDPVVRDDGKEVQIGNLKPDVVFDHVTYRYDNTTEDVLHDVSFHVDRGQVVALVGESGAGKTTCMNLLSRMWDVNKGSIRIGGVDIRDMKLHNLHELVSVVPQDVYLFNISMKENIRLGRPDASDEEVEEAAKMAMVHDFIVSLPDGYDTIAGERGLQMSGGQRQRIAIARALLQDTPILVMDEAVSNLDTKTDMEIQKTIRSLADKKTIILVAHRLSTILEADNLIVMNKGKVVQRGTHRELLSMPGYYRELMNAQLQGN